MASNQPRDQEMQVPMREGEFHRIPGIGPGIEQRLHAAGIHTFDHLASLTPDEICAMLSGVVGLTPERIDHQAWPEKAKLLAKELHETGSPFEAEEPGERQHYASFLVELLQDEEQSVRRTRVAHVQAGSRDSWAGWDRQRLLEWIEQRSGIISAGDRSKPAGLEEVSPAQPSETANEPSAPQPPAAQEGRRRAIQPVNVLSAGVIDPNSAEARPFLYTGNPAQMRLALDMRGTGVETGTPLSYHLMVEARPLGAIARIPLAELSGERAVEDEIVLVAPLQELPEGTYHLSVSAKLIPGTGLERLEKGGLFVFTEGGIIHVFSEVPAPAG